MIIKKKLLVILASLSFIIRAKKIIMGFDIHISLLATLETIYNEKGG